MSWMGAVAFFGAAVAMVGIGLLVTKLMERQKIGPGEKDSGTIGCGVILLVMGMTLIGAVVGL